MKKNGWQDRVEVIIFDPELEAWVWTESLHTAKSLGWNDDPKLKNWLLERGYWQNKSIKPTRPKEALESALREKRIPRSSPIYQEIAKRVSLEKCQDHSFKTLREILSKWFPCK